MLKLLVILFIFIQLSEQSDDLILFRKPLSHDKYLANNNHDLESVKFLTLFIRNKTEAMVEISYFDRDFSRIVPNNDERYKPTNNGINVTYSDFKQVFYYLINAEVRPHGQSWNTDGFKITVKKYLSPFFAIIIKDFMKDTYIDLDRPHTYPDILDQVRSNQMNKYRGVMLDFTEYTQIIRWGNHLMNLIEGTNDLDNEKNKGKFYTNLMNLLNPDRKIQNLD